MLVHECNAIAASLALTIQGTCTWSYSIEVNIDFILLHDKKDTIMKLHGYEQAEYFKRN